MKRTFEKKNYSGIRPGELMNGQVFKEANHCTKLFSLDSSIGSSMLSCPFIFTTNRCQWQKPGSLAIRLWNPSRCYLSVAHTNNAYHREFREHPFARNLYGTRIPMCFCGVVSMFVSRFMLDVCIMDITSSWKICQRDAVDAHRNTEPWIIPNILISFW